MARVPFIGWYQKSFPGVGLRPFQHPFGLFVDAQSNLWVADNSAGYGYELVPLRWGPLAGVKAE
jgi:hypothetical protein